ncbi:hypothetical protein [Pimelobacter sp. 30-1]|uniref:hypothetical protein n=1 Tax=Pimelobacter sp. 30-1 TaxID=2004991 RepID=UPI001C05B309|nr:hypothetical protein [Pimelobacter sp. 30-1]MBU2698087.1 hypothetical protein [Pimelobacter sp. 30-1]
MGDAINRAATESEEPKPASPAAYGAIAKSVLLDVKTDEIYGTGHVRVSVLPTSKSPHEKLRSIKFTQQIHDHSGAGHLGSWAVWAPRGSMSYT